MGYIPYLSGWRQRRCLNYFRDITSGDVLTSLKALVCNLGAVEVVRCGPLHLARPANRHSLRFSTGIQEKEETQKRHRSMCPKHSTDAL